MEKKSTNYFSFAPVIFDLSLNKDKKAMENLLLEKPYTAKIDEIRLQIEELLQCQEPNLKKGSDEMSFRVKDYTSRIVLEEYGVWVYYPWNNNLVHILPEEDFIKVRTNRNKLKITEEEQNQLGKKTVAIIGLSVGKSIAITMAAERVFGELRIADFDTLDLSNMNRLVTGVHNLNVPKTVILAREIAEIDPFLKVKCYHEGVSKDTLHEFLTEDGGVDLLLDECDDITTKIESRKVARQLQIPVVMDTSDRGMIDVERYDLEPDRSFFHGLVDVEEELDRMELVKKIIDYPNVSPRLKTSFEQVGRTISSWPQLASSVMQGAGITTAVVRNIFLNNRPNSGRFYNDELS